MCKVQEVYVAMALAGIRDHCCLADGLQCYWIRSNQSQLVAVRKRVQLFADREVSRQICPRYIEIQQSLLSLTYLLYLQSQANGVHAESDGEDSVVPESPEKSTPVFSDGGATPVDSGIGRFDSEDDADDHVDETASDDDEECSQA